MMDIRGLAYVVAETTDLSTWSNYATDVLGMMVSQIRSGVSGRSRIATPTAWLIAEPTAAAIDRSPPSPAPFAPEGPGPSSFSIRNECSSAGISSIVGIR